MVVKRVGEWCVRKQSPAKRRKLTEKQEIKPEGRAVLHADDFPRLVESAPSRLALCSESTEPGKFLTPAPSCS